MMTEPDCGAGAVAHCTVHTVPCCPGTCWGDERAPASYERRATSIEAVFYEGDDSQRRDIIGWIVDGIETKRITNLRGAHGDPPDVEVHYLASDPHDWGAPKALLEPGEWAVVENGQYRVVDDAAFRRLYRPPTNPRYSIGSGGEDRTAALLGLTTLAQHHLLEANGAEQPDDD